jgi:hypothetical protein
MTFSHHPFLKVIARRRTLVRALIACGSLLCMCGMARAQRPAELTYKASFTGLLPGAAEKYVIEAYHDQDPDVDLSLDVALQQAKVRTRVPLHEAQLAAALAAHGMGLTLTVALQPGDGDHRGLAVPGFPVLANTGDPASDHAVYEAAKQAWIAAHPTLYEAMQQAATP